MLKKISSFLEVINQREDLMQQMKQWIDTCISEEFSTVKPVICFSPDLLGDSKPRNIETDMERIYGVMERLKNIADSLGIGERKEDTEVTVERPSATPIRVVKPTVSMYNGKI